MTIDELAVLAARVSRYRRSGNAIEVEGSLDLSRLTTLPEGVTLTAGSYLDLGNLTTLPEGVTLTARKPRHKPPKGA